jgi:hypothetical protein
MICNARVFPAIALHHDFLDRYREVDFGPDDWYEEEGKLILDLERIKND